MKSSEFNNVIPIFILDNVNSEENNLGGASRWWLHNSLKKLNSKFDNKISFYKGDPIQIFKDIEKKLELNAVFWNRIYEPWSIERDKKIKKYLTDKNIKVYSYNSSLLWEPTEILKSDKTPYKVFTPFYKKTYLSKELDLKLYDLPNLDNILDVSNPGSSTGKSMVPGTNSSESNVMANNYIDTIKIKLIMPKSKIKIFDFKFFPIPNIAFNASLACRLPTIFAVDTNIPSLSQYKNSSCGSV